MAHNIKIVVSVTVDGDGASWSTDTTTELNPYNIAASSLMGVRDQAAEELRKAGTRHSSGMSARLGAV
jgi:hypothetical protein